VCSEEPPRERQRFVIGHTAYEIRNRQRVRMAVRNGSGLAVDERTDLKKSGYHDVIVTDVRTRGEKVTRNVNIYNPKDTQSRERPAQKLGWQQSCWHGCTMLAGDLNAHSR